MTSLRLNPLHLIIGGALLCAALCVPTSLMAGREMIYISSGTGFLVSRDGYIVTNAHVVPQCERVIVGGAIHKHLATIIGRDTVNDLALLKVEEQGFDIGSLRDLEMPLRVQDRVVIVGYPGQAAITGKLVTREAEIVNVKGPQGEGKWVQLSDVVEQGNSGGPLLDSAGNVVGVVSAKLLSYTYEKDNPDNGTYTRTGVAISLSTLMEFLDAYNVRYQQSNADGYLSADRITDQVERYVVNIHCEYRTEVR